jgi:hypothetical protein
LQQLNFMSGRPSFILFRRAGGGILPKESLKENPCLSASRRDISLVRWNSTPANGGKLRPQ